VLEEQRAAVEELLRGLPALHGLDSSRGGLARKLVQKAVGQLQRLSERLTGILPAALLREFVAAVLDAPCALLADKVLALADIAESDCAAIANLCDKLWKEPSLSVEANVDGLSACDGKAESLPVAQLCKQALRLRAIAELLRVRMAEVVEGWQRGTYQAAGLSAAEVKSMVNAVFQDNEFRRNCLGAIDGSA
jgi:hypothetical protein